MNFFHCPICKLDLPKNYAVPIVVHSQGQTIRALICRLCKEKKEKEKQ